jgi:hypothetical protein
MSNLSSATGASDQQLSSPTKQRKMRGGKKFEKFDKGTLSEPGAPAIATSAQSFSPLIDKEMCSLETWLECSSDHLEGLSFPNPITRNHFALWLFPSRAKLFHG